MKPKMVLVAAAILVGAAVAMTSGEPAAAGGYDRSCAAGRGCVFGPAWTDDVDVELGHNGCGTRDDVLRRDLRDVELKPGTNGCVVLSGALTDPYSGAQVAFSKLRADQVQIDHIVPLAQAWNRGAAGWTTRERTRFANDPLNLVATTAAVNRAKSDKMPGEWSPNTSGGRCFYVDRFQRVTDKYQLAVTVRERAALVWIGRGCPSA